MQMGESLVSGSDGHFVDCGCPICVAFALQCLNQRIRGFARVVTQTGFQFPQIVKLRPVAFGGNFCPQLSQVGILCHHARHSVNCSGDEIVNDLLKTADGYHAVVVLHIADRVFAGRGSGAGFDQDGIAIAAECQVGPDITVPGGGQIVAHLPVQAACSVFRFPTQPPPVAGKPPGHSQGGKTGHMTDGVVEAVFHRGQAYPVGPDGYLSADGAVCNAIRFGG